jgi:hypothetical protein
MQASKSGALDPASLPTGPICDGNGEPISGGLRAPAQGWVRNARCAGVLFRCGGPTRPAPSRSQAIRRFIDAGLSGAWCVAALVWCSQRAGHEHTALAHPPIFRSRPTVQRFKEQPIYEQSAAQTLREQQQKRPCGSTRQPLKIEQLRHIGSWEADGKRCGWAGALTDGRVAPPYHAVDRNLDGRAVLPRQCDRR